MHFARNLLALVAQGQRRHGRRGVPHDLRPTRPRQPSHAAWDEVRDQLAARFPKIGALMDDAKAEVLAFTAFPEAHWQKIWSTNPLERINKEIPVFYLSMPQGPRRWLLRSVIVPRSDSKEISTPRLRWLSSV